MNYQEALAYLYSLSNFERGGPYTRNPEENLRREAALLKQLGNPQQSYTSTLIAGTKGKGSTAVFIEHVLRQAGLHTGLYTQPDLHTFRERIRVNGQLLREDEAAELLTEIRPVAERLQAQGQFGPFITYEIATALALLYFARQHVQHAVLEVGLGGRLDATNVTHPVVSVITSISYDHMQILGHTLTEIATEKAGIIKPSGIVVTSAQSPEALLVIADVSRREHAKLVRVGPAEADAAKAEVSTGKLPPLDYVYRVESSTVARQRFTVHTPEHTYSGLEISLAGRYQIENATAALATLEMLRKKGIMWDEAALREGLQRAYWPARLQVIGYEPTIIVDGAHNADSVQKLMEAMGSIFVYQRVIVVLSVARDKDLEGIVRVLVGAGVDTVVLTMVANPRMARVEEMEAVFAKYAPGMKIYATSQSTQAMDLALKLADVHDMICATGSLYLAGEVLRWAAAHGNQRAKAEIEGVDH